MKKTLMVLLLVPHIVFASTATEAELPGQDEQKVITAKGLYDALKAKSDDDFAQEAHALYNAGPKPWYIRLSQVLEIHKIDHKASRLLPETDQQARKKLASNAVSVLGELEPHFEFSISLL